MDIAKLKNLITAALARSPFQVSGADLSSTPVTTLLLNHLGSDSLALSGAGNAGETATSISVKGKFASPFLQAPNLTAVAVFTVDAGQNAQVNLTLNGLAAGWSLSTSLPQLKETLFDLFSYSDAQFILDSSLGTILPKDFPARYGFPAYTPEYAQKLIPGLSFQATMTVVSEVTGMSKLLPGNSWTLSGPIQTESDLPSVLLSSHPGTGITVAGFSIAFGLNLAAAVIAVKDDSDGPSVTCSIQLEADIAKKLASGATLDIPVYARAFNPDFSLVHIESNLSSASAIVFDDIASLIDGGSTSGLIPGAFPKLVDIQLQKVGLTYLPPTNKVTRVSATVGFQPGKGKTWDIFDGLIVFDSFSVAFTLLPETGGVNVDVGCVAQFSGGTIDASISLPDMYFSFELAEDAPPIDIGAMVKKITKGTVTMDNVRCTDLKFFGTAGSFYQFRATISDLWTFHIGSKPVQISEVGMDLTYTPAEQNPLSGQVIGTFNIAGASLFASAAYDAASNGWIFSGGTQGKQEISITNLLNDVLELFSLQLPANTPQIILENLNISFNTATRQFDFLAASTFTVVGVPFELGLEVSLEQEQKRFMGYLFFGDYGFEVDYQSGSQASIMKGSWQATKDQSALAIAQLFTALDLHVPPLPGESILSLKAASVTYNITQGSLLITAENVDQDKVLGAFIPGDKEGDPMQWVLGLQLGQTISLSDLPLVGSALSKLESITIEGLKILASAHPISAKLATDVLNLNPPAGYPVPPAAGTPAALEINADVVLGTDRMHLNLDIGSTTRQAALPAPGVAAASSTNAVWFSIQKSFGPLTLDRIGLQYSSGTSGGEGATLSFLVDGTLAVGGLSITLQGASIGSTLDKFSPVFGLQGLGISYSNPPLVIGGGFLQQSVKPPVDWEYSGVITVETGTVSLTAFGSYASVSGQPSMFLFGQVTAPIGGPPYFFVTGFAGGFGYNSQVRIPAQNEVYQFPLVSGLTNSSVLGKNPTPLQVLAVLTAGTNPWVAPTVGQKWIAAGISFTTFEVLKSTALLVVEFGNELILALLGLSKASFPSKGPVYAQVELQIAMVFEPAKGVFSFTAQLTPNSFLIDPKCVLTGGFAFCLWFAGSGHDGDFVVTVGGYHALFDPPKYYPAEPRVGFAWPMDSTITISGQAYFALTPSAIMAGGMLNVVFQSGNLKAWFKAWADLIIWWTPIHFKVEIGVSIGASYTLHIFGCTKTLTVELGANVTLWGPPTGGTATVHLWIFSFTIDFGARPLTPPIATWEQVQTLLPASHEALKVVAVKGMTTSEPAKSGNVAENGPEPAKLWVARRDTFTFSTSCAVPSSAVIAGGVQVQTSAAVNIQPMQLTGLASQHVVVITNSGKNDVTSRFQSSADVGNVPTGLWGTGANDKVNNGPQLIKDQLTGMRFQVPPPALGQSLGPVNIAKQLSGDPLKPNGIEPLAASEGPSGPIARTDPDTINTISTGIMADLTVSTRTKLYEAMQAMQIAPGDNGNLKTFAGKAGELFIAEPLIISKA